MRKLPIILFIALLPVLTGASYSSLVSLRELYYKAAKDKAYDETFYRATQQSAGIDKTLLEGYAGMAWMIRANHAFNPYNKLSYFYKGKALLDGAIKADAGSTELRFLRYGVQTNAPGFLGYSGSIKEDKAVILATYSTLQDVDLKERIRGYMMASSHCSADEKEAFRTLQLKSTKQ